MAVGRFAAYRGSSSPPYECLAMRPGAYANAAWVDWWADRCAPRPCPGRLPRALAQGALPRALAAYGGR